MIKTIEIRPLNNHKYSNCRVYITEDTTTGKRATVFESYKTTAASIDGDGFLAVTCLCSATTRKQVSWFLREYAPIVDYQLAKRLYNDGVAMNLYTGEIIDLYK